MAARNDVPHRTVSAALAIAAISIAGSAQSAEYCVTCEGPAAMYACAIEGTEADATPDPRLQLLCISELAKAGGHEVCSVPRSAPKPCPGVMKIVAAPAMPPPPAATEAEAPAADPTFAAPDDSSDHAKSPDEPPRTVEEMAKKTVESTKKGLETAGDAIKGTTQKAGENVEKAGSTVTEAAKKTWNCVTSLFSQC